MLSKEKLWNVSKVILKLAVTTVLLYLVFQKIDIGALKHLFLKSNFYYIFLCFVLYFLAAVIASFRNRIFLNNIGLILKTGFNFRLYLLGMFYNVTLPGGIGGDGYKIYILRKKFRLPTKRIFLAMLFDRLSGLWAIGVLAVILVLMLPQLMIPKAWPIFALSIGTVVYFLLMRHFFKDFSHRFVQTHGLALAVQAIHLLIIIFILLSQDFDAKYAPYLFSFLIATLAANIPVSAPGGAGVREYVMIHASEYFNMDENQAVFICITYYIIGTLCALTGIWFVYRSKEFEPAPKQKAAIEFEKRSDEEFK